MADKDKQAETIPAETIFVQPRAEYLVPDSGGGYRTAIWERHPAHPGGEVNIAGPEIVEVAQTSEVMAKLAPRLQDGGTLVRLEGKALERAQSAAAASRRTAAEGRDAVATARAAAEAARMEAAEARANEQTTAAALAKVREELAALQNAAK